MMINIRRRSDDKFNVWRKDEELPKAASTHEVRASEWQVIAVCATHAEAEALRAEELK
jgi:hypothetical protein